MQNWPMLREHQAALLANKKTSISQQPFQTSLNVSKSTTACPFTPKSRTLHLQSLRSKSLLLIFEILFHSKDVCMNVCLVDQKTCPSLQMGIFLALLIKENICGINENTSGINENIFSVNDNTVRI